MSVDIVTGDEKIWWKKVGGGSFQLNGKMIKPNQQFKASLNEIPKAFRDVVIPMQSVPETIEETPMPGTKATYILEPTKRKGFYNVVQEATGKKMNEKVLNKETADQLIKDLEK